MTSLFLSEGADSFKLGAQSCVTTHFITAEIDLHQTPARVKRAIEEELEKQGEPLRWAIASVDTETKKVRVEAIVLAK